MNFDVGPCMNKAFEEGIFRKLYAYGFKQLEAVCEKIWTIYKDEINSLWVKKVGKKLFLTVLPSFFILSLLNSKYVHS